MGITAIAKVMARRLLIQEAQTPQLNNSRKITILLLTPKEEMLIIRLTTREDFSTSKRI